MNTLGRLFRVSIVGESHGRLVGVLVDGVPAGIQFSEADVQPDLDRRRPGQSVLTTQRKEGDACVIRSGVLNGRTTGAPVLMEVPNADTRSQDYGNLVDTPRPGHSDYPARVKYAGFNDPRGGGMFSGRLTAALVMAGGLARNLLRAEGIEVAAHTVQLGTVRGTGELALPAIRARHETNAVRTAYPDDVAKRMEDEIHAAREALDSVGGVVECVADGVPVGLGEPITRSVEAAVSEALWAVPAVKGVEFGSGFAIAALRGSEARDEYYSEAGKIRTRANHNGGVLGGISTGMPVRFRVALKPTSSIPREQETVDLTTGETATLKVKGRHDPCIVPRAVPVIEAAALVALADLVLLARATAPHREGSP